MKYRTTRKAIKETYGNANIYEVGSGNLQYLLRFIDPFAYSTRVEGWACDYYDIGNGIVLVDGYAPFGKKVNFDTMKLFDDKAREIWDEFYHADYELCKKLTQNLVADFRGIIKGGV